MPDLQVDKAELMELMRIRFDVFMEAARVIGGDKSKIAAAAKSLEHAVGLYLDVYNVAR